MTKLSIVISENRDYDTSVLTPSSLIDYKLSIVNNGPKQYLIHASSGTTTLSKLNYQLSELPFPIDRSIRVELDLYVNSGGEKIHFATISEDSELAKSFSNNVGEEYPYIFATWAMDKMTRVEGPIIPVNLYLIDEAAMKKAIFDNAGGNWEDQEVDITEVQSRVSELEGTIRSAQLKLQSYKRSSSDLAYKGLGIEQTEIKFAEMGVPMSIVELYSLYAKLATYTTLTGDAKTKSGLITNIYKNYTTLINLITPTEG